MSYIDLHLHSIHSDGCFSPRQIVEKAVKKSLKAIALTDHDSISGFEELSHWGNHYGLEVMQGIELSAEHQGRDTHILGYGFDHRHAQLVEYIDKFKQSRLERAHRIVENLQKMGLDMSIDDIRIPRGCSVGRPHIAKALIEKGYVRDFNQAFNRYLGERSKAYVAKFKISVSRVTDLIHAAGGAAFLAHPGLRIKEKDLYAIIRSGIDGIEVIHPKHDERAAAYFQRITEMETLLRSGGSDCHGLTADGAIGNMNVPHRFLEEIKAYLKSKPAKITASAC